MLPSRIGWTAAAMRQLRHQLATWLGLGWLLFRLRPALLIVARNKWVGCHVCLFKKSAKYGGVMDQSKSDIQIKRDERLSADVVDGGTSISVGVFTTDEIKAELERQRIAAGRPPVQWPNSTFHGPHRPQPDTSG